MVEIHVTDNGPGIPDDIKDTVFYPMVSRKEGGHGLRTRDSADHHRRA